MSTSCCPSAFMRSDSSETIAAIATARGEGGIAIIRISGEGAFSALNRVFSRNGLQKDAPWARNRLYLGIVHDDGEMVDEAMAVFMPGPRSYTREDVAEIHLHGGAYAADKALSLVLRSGVRAAEPGEFTLRAFLNGRIDLAQAEAVMKMIAAGSEADARAAARQMEGGLTRFVGGFSDRLTDLIALIEAGVDFPDEIDEQASAARVAEAVDEMIFTLREASDERAARIVREGLTVALAGAPNAGKSSLLNALTRSDRAIVTPVAGTTRDVLTERLRVSGLDITLMDTAGIRETGDLIEREGVLRAKRAMDGADVVLAVLDGSVPESAEERELLTSEDGRFIRVLNKRDLGLYPGRTGLPVSAKTGEGMEDLLREIVSRAGNFEAAEGRLTQKRHIDLAKRAVAALVRAKESLEAGAPLDFASEDLKEALRALSEIVGKDATEAVIASVFRNFCVGK